MISKNFIKNQNSGEKFLKHDKIGCGDYVCNHFSFYCQWEWLRWKKFPTLWRDRIYHNEDTWKTEFYIRRLAQKFMKIFIGI